jgi:transcriptional regulator with XRE-family HTH domain
MSRESSSTSTNADYHDVSGVEPFEPIGSIARRLREIRHETLQCVSKRAGLTSSRLRRIEQLRSSPREQEIRGVARAFDLPVGALFGEQDSRLQHQLLHNVVVDTDMSALDIKRDRRNHHPIVAAALKLKRRNQISEEHDKQK